MLRPGPDTNDTNPAFDLFMTNTAILLQLLKQDAMTTAKRFAACCGRDIATDKDMFIALKYEVRTFLSRPNLEERFSRMLTEIQRDFDAAEQTADETSDETSETESDEESEESKEEDQKEILLTCVTNDTEFHAQALQFDLEWAAWQPEDSAYSLLKAAVNNTIRAFPTS